MPDEASLIITNSGIPNFAPEPGFIAFGELTLNWADGILYFKDIGGTVRSFSTTGAAPLIFNASFPVNEGVWPAVGFFPSNPPNTLFYLVQNSLGVVPRLKVGLIESGPNYVEVDETDITVGAVAGTTFNELKGLIDSDEEASALLWIFPVVEVSDGTGVIAVPAIADAEFAWTAAQFNPLATRATNLGQKAIIQHSDGTRTEWAAISINPSIWYPTTAGVIRNTTSNRWEKLFIANGTFQSNLIPDQD